jgi:hypothetical protein
MLTRIPDNRDFFLPLRLLEKKCPFLSMPAVVKTANCDKPQQKKTSNDAGFNVICLMFRGCFVVPARFERATHSLEGVTNMKIIKQYH